MSSKTIRIAIIGAFVLAVGVRLFLLSRLHHEYFFAGIAVADGELARHLAQGEGFVVNETHMQAVAEDQKKKQKLIDIGDVPRPARESLTPYHHALPGYSVLLALSYWLTGKERYLDLQVFQAILDSIGVFLIYLLGTKVFSRNIGVLSAFFYALWVPQARLSIAPLHDAPMAFLLLLSTIVYFEGERKDSLGLMALSSILLGLTAYVRSDYIFLPVFFALTACLKRAWAEGTDIVSRKSLATLLHGAWMTAIVFLLVLPWGIRNYMTFHRFTILRPVLWQSVWEGFGEFPNPFGAVLDDTATFHMVEKEHPGISYLDPEYQKVLKDKSLSAVKKHPGWYLSMLPRRFLRMLLARNDWGLPLDPEANYRTFSARGGSFSAYIRRTPPIQIFYRLMMRGVENGLVVMSLVGVFLFRRQWRNFILILSVPACGFLTHLPIYWEPRYLLPGNYPLLILSAAVVERLWTRVRKPR